MGLKPASADVFGLFNVLQFHNANLGALTPSVFNGEAFEFWPEPIRKVWHNRLWIGLFLTVGVGWNIAVSKGHSAGMNLWP